MGVGTLPVMGIIKMIMIKNIIKIFQAKITFSIFHRFWQDSLELASTGYAWLEVKECRLCLVTKREQHCLSNLLKIKHREESGGWGLKLRKL